MLIFFHGLPGCGEGTASSKGTRRQSRDPRALRFRAPGLYNKSRFQCSSEFQSRRTCAYVRGLHGTMQLARTKGPKAEEGVSGLEMTAWFAVVIQTPEKGHDLILPFCTKQVLIARQCPPLIIHGCLLMLSTPLYHINYRYNAGRGTVAGPLNIRHRKIIQLTRLKVAQKVSRTHRIQTNAQSEHTA
jgi:hypothetical protein